MLILAFCRNRDPFSWMIRFITRSGFSHVAIVDGSNVVEAGWPKVQERSFEALCAKHSVVELVNWPFVDAVPVLAAARSQIGKPYDWKALLGFLFRRDWQCPDSWFCSELVAWAFEQGNARLFRQDAMRRVTPRDLWVLEPR